MTKIRAWISAARLRTLPLSIAGIITGAGMAYDAGKFDGMIFGLAILTTLGFQILSNFANDYGDGVKGTDNAERIGPARAMQSGLLTARELKHGMLFTAGITFFLSLGLIYAAFSNEKLLISIFFLVLGLVAIAAAVLYTVGNKAYGYKGFGDVFVFLFFGLVAVCGSYFLFVKDLSGIQFLPAIAIGLLSTGVLNLNNMRDRLPDSRVGKRTLAVIMGAQKVKMYHGLLIGIAFMASTLYLQLTQNWLWSGLCLLVFIPLLLHLIKVFKNQSPALLDPELKKVALATFAYSLFFILGFIIA